MQNPRTRLVSLRMTEDEYERLRGASQGQGARSVSEFARTALLVSKEQQSLAHCGCQNLNALDERLTRVEQDLARVKQDLAD
jgi:hypothetical protein